VRSGNSARRLSTVLLILMVLTLGVIELSGCAGEDNDVILSSRQLFRHPPGGRNGRGSRRQWVAEWRRPLRITTWNPSIVPGWGWGVAIHRCGWRYH
jgi:hypothetical protein